MAHHERITIVGAGLAGCATALELARYGIETTLVDQDSRPMQRASRRNEGKIHLGFVYANEASRSTTDLMVDGATVFGPLVKSWLGRPPIVSQPFQYLVHRDSVVDSARFEVHCASVGSAFERAMGNPDREYLGHRPRNLWNRLPRRRWRSHRAGGEIIDAFQTAEIAIDTDRLATELASRVLTEPRIRFVGDTTIQRFEPSGDGFTVHGERHHLPWELRTNRLVNCTWERRAALDRSLGILPPNHLLHRLKYRAIVDLPSRWRNALSMTMVVGAYGDIVVRRDGTGYLSWYPVCRQGWSTDCEPPRDWDFASRGALPRNEAVDMIAAILAGLEPYYPGISESRLRTIDAGAIVASGHTDVDDRSSGLHSRHRVGYEVRGNHYTLDPGKLTTAPMFGARLALHIAQDLGIPHDPQRVRLLRSALWEPGNG